MNTTINPSFTENLLQENEENNNNTNPSLHYEKPLIHSSINITTLNTEIIKNDIIQPKPKPKNLCIKYWTYYSWKIKLIHGIIFLSIAQLLGWGLPALLRHKYIPPIQPNFCYYTPNPNLYTTISDSYNSDFLKQQRLNFSLTSKRQLHLLEPVDGIILHGGGQDDQSFAQYFHYMGNQAPELFMTYIGLDYLNNTNISTYYFSTLLEQLNCYTGKFLIPQFGLSMIDNGPPYDDKVAAGEYDFAINQLVIGLESLNRPVFMRLGFEFNGPWSGYKPVTFNASWSRIYTAVRASPKLQSTVAFVWDYSCDYPSVPPDNFAVPADQIDWYGVNIYSGPAAPDDLSCVVPFIELAQSRGYPVLFAESTPRFIGASLSSWNPWYQPYLNLMSKYNTTVKAFSYINMDWSQTIEWSNWGDSRVQLPGNVGPKWKTALSNSLYFNADNEANVLAVLGV